MMTDDKKDFVAPLEIDLSQAKQTPMQRELQAQVGGYVQKEGELQKRLEDVILKKR